MSPNLTRINPRYNQHRTDTGRTSSGSDDSDVEKSGRKAPQVQNWPRPLRDVIVAPPGHLLVGADWAAIEWCLCMYDAGIQLDSPYHLDLLDRFQRKELDPHTFLAAKAFSKDPQLPVYDKEAPWKGPPGLESQAVTVKERKQAKPFTFGHMFGGADDALADNARVPRPIGHIVCAAHDEVYQLPPWQAHTYALAKKQHKVTTLGGWVRWFWAHEPKDTEVLATRIQGSAADLMKWAMINIWRTKPEWFIPFTTTHDFFGASVPIERLDEGKEFLRRHMEAPVPWLGGRSWRAEVKSGPNWRSVT